MNLKTLSSPLLLSQLQSLVIEERKLTTQILHHLHEVESRLLFAELGYCSLYEFCTKHLGYSDGSAYRRIQAMRLLKTLPAEERARAESKIEAGTLNLTHLSLAHTLIKTEKKQNDREYTAQQKVDLLHSLESTSKLEAERIVAAIQPAVQKAEKVRVITDDLTEIRFNASAQLMSKLERVRATLAHVDPNLPIADLIERLADHYLEKTRQKTKTPPAESRRESATPESGPPRNRSIPARTKRLVWQRDQGACTYVSPDGRACSSRFGLEFDNIQPYSQGGTHAADNLRLRCRAHNQLHARDTTGLKRRSA